MVWDWPITPRWTHGKRPGYMVYRCCNPGTCPQKSFCVISNTSGISVSCLSKIGSNTDWSEETLELEIRKILCRQLKVPTTVWSLCGCPFFSELTVNQLNWCKFRTLSAHRGRPVWEGVQHAETSCSELLRVGLRVKDCGSGIRKEDGSAASEVVGWCRPLIYLGWAFLQSFSSSISVFDYWFLVYCMHGGVVSCSFIHCVHRLSSRVDTDAIFFTPCDPLQLFDFCKWKTTGKWHLAMLPLSGLFRLAQAERK